MGKLKTLAAAVSLLLAAAALSGCDDGKTSAQAAAAELASALSALDVGKVHFSNINGSDATAKIAAATKSALPVRPDVSVDNVQVTNGLATAALKVQWKFTSGSWSYATSAAMVKNDGDWKVKWQPDVLLPGFDDGDILRVDMAAGRRADILGDGGAVLVTDRAVVRVGIDKSRIDATAQPNSAKALASVLDLDPAAYAQQVAAAGSAAFVEALVLRDDDSRTVSDARIAEIPGASALKDTLALAPTRTFARAILGTVGDATAELIDNSNGSLKSGEVTGLSGLEQQYNGQLSGTPGIIVSRMRAASGEDTGKSPSASASPTGGTNGTAQQGSQEQKPEVVFATEPTAGTPVNTTLNVKLQNLAESVLADQAGASAIVAIRPSTGAVIAAASGPGSNGYNTALLGQYAPGSTFKVATSLALLRKGQTPETPQQCTPTLSVDGKSFKNAGSYPAAHLGSIPLRDAFAHSCNTAFISNQAAVSQGELASAAASLGLGVDSQLGAPAFFGAVPETAAGTEHAAAMIGQGKVLVSPLSIATVAASVAYGALVPPKLVLPAADPGDPLPATPQSMVPTTTATATATAPPTATPKVGPPLTSAEAAQLKDMMRAVVTSGHAGFLAEVPVAPVLAKTGTAEYGTELPLKTHAWIIAAQGDLAVAVFVENGDYGSVSGGPLLTAFLTGAAN